MNRRIHIVYFLVFVLHGFSCGLPRIIPFTFLISFLFFLFVYDDLRKAKYSFDEILVVLMCYALPFSFRNIFGGNFEKLPLSWFYFFGCVFFINTVITKKLFNKNLASIVYSSLLIILFSLMPLIVTPLAYKSQAISQFIIIVFNYLMIIAVALQNNSVCGKWKKINVVNNAFIYGGYYTALMVIAQCVLYYIFSFDLFGIIKLYKMRVAFAFIFSDVSFESLYLSIVFFYCFIVFFKSNRKCRWRLTLYMSVLIAGAVLTSARTGLFVLFVTLFAFVFFKLKKGIYKILLVIVLLLLMYIVIRVFYYVRSDEALLADTGRFDGYKKALSLLLEKPFIGYGFSRDYISEIMGCAIPHFSILQYAVHGGVVYSIMLIYNQYHIFKYAVRRKSVFVWPHLMILMGCCFIPDMLATRFISLITMLIVLDWQYSNSIKDDTQNNPLLLVRSKSIA